jgi:hypothetical protein
LRLTLPAIFAPPSSRAQSEHVWSLFAYPIARTSYHQRVPPIIIAGIPLPCSRSARSEQSRFSLFRTGLAPSPCQLRSRSKPASCFRHRVPLSGVHLPLRLMSRWPSSSAAPHSPPCPEELTGDPLPGFDAATCHWSCWRLRGARSTPLSPSRRGSFSAAEAYSTHTPGGRGSALIDADLIKGL